MSWHTCAVILLIGFAMWKEERQKVIDNPTPDFKFPTAHLAALDRDLQARFAVIPTKEFGIERVWGNQHYLYVPETPAEHQTIAQLNQEGTDAAFYLMSRALWLRSFDSSGYKPIQGPVYITHPIKGPLPRRIDFYPNGTKLLAEEIVDETKVSTQDDTDIKNGIPTHNDEGTPVPIPTPPKNAPHSNILQGIGNRIFEWAEYAPKTANIGLVEPINESWKVVAVPIRASKPECVSCHHYEQSMGGKTGRIKIELGDAVGVAFYLYATNAKKSSALQPAPKGSSQ